MVAFSRCIPAAVLLVMLHRFRGNPDNWDRNLTLIIQTI
jgi:hypothetical protein